MALCKNHDFVYFDTLRRTNKAETVLSLIQSSYHVKTKEEEKRKEEIAQNLVYAYKLIKGDSGSYTGSLGQFESQYTIGHELGIWINSKLELNPLALKVAKNDITVKKYFDIVFCNYFQPINNIIFHPLFHVLSYMKNNNLEKISKKQISDLITELCSTTIEEDKKLEGTNSLFNMFLGTNFFYSTDNNYLILSQKYNISELINKCDISYIEKGFEIAKQELGDLRVYVDYLTKENTSSEVIQQQSTPSTQTPTQIIFYGVPGSGKSHSIKKELAAKGITDLKEQTKRVVFHPEYTNADFVGQILPQSSDGGTTISYPFVPGPFTQILAKAYTHQNTHYALIIEEINRGNAAAIFGELFQLLDRLDEDETESSNEKSYEKGWSSYPINNDNINKAIQEAYNDSNIEPFISKDKFDTYKLNIGIRLPPNLSIFATMNTSDQNVFKLDNAFKRRWELKLIPNKFKEKSGPEEINQRDAVVEGFDFTWNNFREAVNSIIIDPDNSIDISSFADRQIGCWFAKAIKKDEKYIIEKEVFVHKVLEYLWDDVCNGDIGIFFNENYKSFAELVEDIIENDSTDIFSENLKGKLSQNKPE